MPTPSIQILRTDAQQVLNLDSISAVRSVVAASLANANAGTPLNPNLTTQQLWNEFYQIVTQPKSDIESIIANQLMKFLYAPPAPGGAGADKQVIFNDGGVLAGDPGLTFDKVTNALTITGDLTVDTSTLKVDSANNRVGIGTATPSQPLNVRFDNAGPTTLALFENQLADFASSAAGQIVVGARNYNYTVLRQNPDIGTTPSIGGSLDTVLANISTLGAGVGKLILATQNTARLSVHETTGDVSIANGNLVMSTSGKGIDFSAVTGGTGTATANVLNDYEEGTWVPAINALVGTFTTTTLSSATYTKIGRMVAIQAKFALTNAGTGSAGFQLTNLPFTSSPTNAFVIAGKNLSSDADFGGFIESTGTTMRFVVLIVNTHTYIVNGTYTV